eukprot:scaffold11783_cov120-Cylindrotheca_fusiformis.AAC.11
MGQKRVQITLVRCDRVKCRTAPEGGTKGQSIQKSPINPLRGQLQSCYATQRHPTTTTQCRLWTPFVGERY